MIRCKNLIILSFLTLLPLYAQAFSYSPNFKSFAELDTPLSIEKDNSDTCQYANTLLNNKSINCDSSNFPNSLSQFQEIFCSTKSLFLFDIPQKCKCVYNKNLSFQLEKSKNALGMIQNEINDYQNSQLIIDRLNDLDKEETLFKEYMNNESCKIKDKYSEILTPKATNDPYVNNHNTHAKRDFCNHKIKYSNPVKQTIPSLDDIVDGTTEFLIYFINHTKEKNIFDSFKNEKKATQEKLSKFSNKIRNSLLNKDEILKEIYKKINNKSGHTFKKKFPILAKFTEEIYKNSLKTMPFSYKVFEQLLSNNKVVSKLLSKLLKEKKTNEDLDSKKFKDHAQKLFQNDWKKDFSKKHLERCNRILGLKNKDGKNNQFNLFHFCDKRKKQTSSLDIDYSLLKSLFEDKDEDVPELLKKQFKMAKMRTGLSKKDIQNLLLLNFCEKMAKNIEMHKSNYNSKNITKKNIAEAFRSKWMFSKNCYDQDHQSFTNYSISNFSQNEITASTVDKRKTNNVLSDSNNIINNNSSDFTNIFVKQITQDANKNVPLPEKDNSDEQPPMPYSKLYPDQHYANSSGPFKALDSQHGNTMGNSAYQKYSPSAKFTQPDQIDILIIKQMKILLLK